MTNFHLNGVRDFLSNIANAVKNFATGVSNKKGGGTRSTKRKDRSEIQAETLNTPTNSISKNLDSPKRNIAQNPEVQTSFKNHFQASRQNSSDHISKPSTSKIDLPNLTQRQIEYVKQLNVKEQQDWIDYYQEANNILRKLNDLLENKQKIKNLIHNFAKSENYNLKTLKEFSKLDILQKSESKKELTGTDGRTCAI